MENSKLKILIENTVRKVINENYGFNNRKDLYEKFKDYCISENNNFEIIAYELFDSMEDVDKDIFLENHGFANNEI